MKIKKPILLFRASYFVNFIDHAPNSLWKYGPIWLRPYEKKTHIPKSGWAVFCAYASMPTGFNIQYTFCECCALGVTHGHCTHGVSTCRSVGYCFFCGSTCMNVPNTSIVSIRLFNCMILHDDQIFLAFLLSCRISIPLLTDNSGRTNTISSNWLLRMILVSHRLICMTIQPHSHTNVSNLLLCGYSLFLMRILTYTWANIYYDVWISYSSCCSSIVCNYSNIGRQIYVYIYL